MSKTGSRSHTKKQASDEDHCWNRFVSLISCGSCRSRQESTNEENMKTDFHSIDKSEHEESGRSFWDRVADCLKLQEYQERELGLPGDGKYDQIDYTNVRTPVLQSSSPMRSYMVPSIAESQPARQINPFTFHEHENLPLHIRVCFLDNTYYRGGTVVWTGYRTEQLIVHSLNNIFIVVRADDQVSSATDGTFEGQQLFQSKEKCYVMLKHTDMKKMPSFEIGDYCIIVKMQGQEDKSFFEGGFIRRVIKDNYFILEPMNTNFTTMAPHQYEKQYRDCVLHKAPPPECEPISDHVEAIDNFHFDKLLGRNKGIQGFRNSCYLDTLLFSFFAFSNDFDHLFIDDSEMDSEYLLVLNVIRYNIVYPLRACHFVSHHHVGELRRLMASLINDKFRAENRDIPECMDALFGQLLRVTPMLSIGRATDEKAFFDGAYMAECIQVDNARIPTSKLLLENAAVQMDFCIEEMPKCFMLQLPRDSERDGFILPSYKLDLKNLLYRSVKVCTGCRCNATLQFPALMNTKRDLAATFFCEDCANAASLDLSASKRIPKPDLSSVLDEDTELKISALICIERSHYNCFVRCGERWVFFDSMNDQNQLKNPETKESETFNIPLVEEVPDFQKWLTDAQRCVKNSGSLNTFFASLHKNDRQKAERVFRYPYNIIYRPVDS